MIRNEMTRLLNHPKFKIMILLLTGIFALNILASIPNKQYDTLYKSLPQDKETVLNEPFYSELMNTEDGSDIINQVDYIENRKKAITSELDNLEAMLKSGLLDSKRDVKKVDSKINFYNNQLNYELYVENVELTERRLNSMYPIISILAVGVLLGLLIFYDDYESGFNNLYKTSKMGLSRLFYNKLVLYILILFLSAFVFYLVDYIIISKNNYIIQSIPSFSNVYKPMTVLSYLNIHYIKIILLTLLVSTSICSLSFVIKRASIVWLLVSLISLFQWLLSVFISTQSKVSFFKNFNIYTMLFRHKFEYPSFYLKVVSIILMLNVLALGVLYLFYTGKFTLNKQFNLNLSLKSTNVLLNSLYQVLITSGGGFVLVIIFLFSLYNMNTFKLSDKPGERSYIEYKQQHIGRIDESLINRLEDLSNVMNQSVTQRDILLKEVEADPDKANDIYLENYEIFEIAKDEGNLERLLQEIELSLEYGVENLVDSRGANLLLMINQYRFIIMNLSVLFGSLILIGYHQSKTKMSENNLPFIKTSKVGEKRYNKIENKSLLILSMLSVGLLMLMHFIKIERRLPINWNNSLRDLLIIDLNISLGLTYLSILLVLSLLGFVFIKIGSVNYQYKQIRKYKKI